MKSGVLFLSVLLNVILAASLIREKGGVSHEPQDRESSSSATNAFVAASSVKPAAEPVVLQMPAPKFHWSQIESTNYLAYIENLRAIGCPEETVRDIIVADVNKLFAPRYAALTQSAPELAWWAEHDEKKPLRAELADQLRQLHEEKKALLVRLLGPGVEVERALVEERVASVRESNFYEFLPESKQGAVRYWFDRYRTLIEWNEPQWRGLPTDEIEAAKKELREERDRELAALLTPEEYRELQLRFSDTSDYLRQEFGKADLTEAEFRELYEQRLAFERENPNAVMEDWKRLEAQYAETLGAERYADVERQNDSMWRAMREVSDENALSSDLMHQAYDIKEVYQERMVAALDAFFGDVNQDPTPLRAIAAEMESELKAVLGAPTVERLDRLGAIPRFVVQDDGKRKMYSFSRSTASP